MFHFRGSFPPLAKKYVLQLLYVLAPVPAVAMEEWVLDEYASKHKVAIDRLLQLRVFVEERDRRKEVSYQMNIKFQGNMQKYLVDGGTDTIQCHCQIAHTSRTRKLCS